MSSKEVKGRFMHIVAEGCSFSPLITDKKTALYMQFSQVIPVSDEEGDTIDFEHTESCGITVGSEMFYALRDAIDKVIQVDEAMKGIAAEQQASDILKSFIEKYDINEPDLDQKIQSFSENYYQPKGDALYYPDDEVQ